MSLPYPPAPWHLQGQAVLSLQPIDVTLARSTLPPSLDIVQIFPGQTLGGLYWASYGAGSTLTYHELIVVSALVQRGWRVGLWISHIYVDNPQSVAGGQQIWGLPKQRAEFSWELGEPTRIAVRQGTQLLCRIAYESSIPLFRQKLPWASFGKLGNKLLWFNGSASVNPAWAKAVELEVPATSPFASLGLAKPWVTFAGKALSLDVNRPAAVNP